MHVKSLWIATVCAVAMAVVSGMVVLRHTAAQEPTPVDEHTPFRARVAEHLGITTEELDAAIKQAALDVVAEAEDAGSISNDQADDARERIESGNARRFIGRLQEWRAHRKAVRSAIVDSAAAAIGITPDDLRADLHSGMSIADAADANGASVEDVSARILSDAAAKLTERVADGKIEQAQADEILRRFETRLDDIVNRKKTGPAQ